MEYFDIIDENGHPTGKVISREEAHTRGVLHRTAHVWVVREEKGRTQILLQKRSLRKDSFPGLYDTSSAGHIPAGSEPLPSALRELREELGIAAEADQLDYAGAFRVRYEKEFHGRLFRDNELAWVYVLRRPVDIDQLVLQTTEVDKVDWFDLEEVCHEIRHSRARFCVPTGGLEVLRNYLEKARRNRVMKMINVVNGPQNVPAIIQGCMRMPALTAQQAADVIRNAFELGVNFFDHATCYGIDGEAEKRFGEAFPLTGLRREDVFLQSKCGICPERQEFDWTKENILNSVDAILRRLGTDHLDSLLLHRPDLIFEPEEVAEAFQKLEDTGKVRFFGVSNLMPMQIELLKKYVRQPLVFNQVQLSLDQSQLIDQVLYMNNKDTDMSLSRDGSILDYCRLHDITPQAWSPLQYGFFKGTFVDNPEFPELNKALAEIAGREGVSKSAVAIAWILRHPAKMQAIAGTMNPDHMKDICDAVKVTLSHHDWYQLYLASGKYLP
ncbi:MAG: aldo/keto reductase [Clostridia bacterium]|nr:aldo/keto reductase [Clostridia bacterium]